MVCTLNAFLEYLHRKVNECVKVKKCVWKLVPNTVSNIQQVLVTAGITHDKLDQTFLFTDSIVHLQSLSTAVITEQ